MSADLWTLLINKKYDDVLTSGEEFLKQTGALGVIHVCGLALAGLKDEASREWLRSSLALLEVSPEWFHNAATALKNSGDWEGACEVLTNGITRYPDSAELWYRRSVALLNLNRMAEAKESAETALDLDPGHYRAKFSKAFVVAYCEDMDRGLQLYHDLIDDPAVDADTRLRIHENIACVLTNYGYGDKGLAWLQEHKDMNDPKMKFFEAMMLIGLGDWTTGWPLYRNRCVVLKEKGSWPPPGLSIPIAGTLEELTGKRRVLVLPEQGFGDTIQFIRYVKLLQQVVDQVVIGVPTALKRLAESFIADRPFEVVDEGEPTYGCETAVMMLDLPAIFGATRETALSDIPYFRAQKPVPYRRDHPLVGVCWAGGVRKHDANAHVADARRTIPFKVFKPILDVKGIDFVSLQLADHHRDYPGLIRGLKDDGDFLDAAHVIQGLDLVITVDTAIAHLAGALGKPVWMLNRLGGCWRWGWDERTTTPWYPSMRIFRQARGENWSETVWRVVYELETVYAPQPV